MKARRFPGPSEAEAWLRAQGFAFQGAPNRWRRHSEDGVSYALVRPTGSRAVVVWVSDPRRAARPS